MICAIAAGLALLVYLGCGAGWRVALLRAFVVFGCAVVISTEALSSVHALTASSIFIFWCLVSIGTAGWLLVRRPKPARFLPSHIGIVEAIAYLGIAAVLAVTAVTALASPPNSADAMAYHLPRVIYWAQQHGVQFFPTHYLNQIMLQPMAEYVMLHTDLLSGGDTFANLGQWLGSIVSIVGVTLIAQNLGASARGQAIAGLFCATLPNGILQASGAKNDYVMAAFLVSFVYFTQEWSKRFALRDAIYAGLALALALMTKATAYLFAPGIAIAILYSTSPRHARRLVTLGAVCLAAIVILNGPQFFRNIAFSGSPMGYDSAQADGKFRWHNEEFGWRQTASNLLRNASEQLGARSERWNNAVYAAVVSGHRLIGIDPNDPATTWRWEQYRPPRNSNHEADAPNRWHLLLLVLSATLLAWRGPRREALLYLGGIGAGLILFCFYLKWQPFLGRMFLPLFVLAAPILGLAMEQIRFTVLQVVLCLFLLNNARPALLENWVRPLKGTHNIFRMPRDEKYFSDLSQFHVKDQMIDSARFVGAGACSVVGIDTSQFQVEYPFLAIVRRMNPRVRFMHSGVTNPSARFYPEGEEPVCAVVCFKCSGEKIAQYSGLPHPIEFGNFIVFKMERK